MRLAILKTMSPIYFLLFSFNSTETDSSADDATDTELSHSFDIPFDDYSE